ncbi:MAG: 2-oxo acid dehydrogenase subunit E2 [Planctomycetaceae bacterium]|jgi:pyruvate dehydrogenase E2 component (dihydrolipoamide acetyltransferase)|nr:2-oxo acid dehydrogenase subunit E2 [Planctomycetaceae bacterium]
MCPLLEGFRKQKKEGKTEMATAVIMPRQGQSVESCVIGKWHKKRGDKVAVGDILFSYETDKATFEEEAKTEGVLLALFFEEGDDVECLKNVCVIGKDGESIDEFRPDSGGAVSSSSSFPQEKAKEPETQSGAVSGQAPPPPTAGGNVPISPRARRLAETTGADVRYAVPTGANNRIMERDVQSVINQGHLATRPVQGASAAGVQGTGISGRVTTFDAAQPAPAMSRGRSAAQSPDSPEYEEVKLSNIRKVVAKAMHASLTNSAQLTLHSSFDATDILEFRKKLKAAAEKFSQPNVTVTDIIVYALSRILPKHRSINAHFMGESMKLFNRAHVGIAVDTPRGLLVPTLSNADTMTLFEVSANAKALIEQSKQGSIPPDLLKNGTFTISNLGTMGIEVFTPVLNPPQTGILGVCSLVERTRNGKPYPAMGLSLTFDHRALDGADAARFLKDLVDYLESFSVSILLA